MRYRCNARGQECLVEVELSSDRIRVMIYSAGGEKIPLYPYNATIDTTRACPDPEAFAEQVAREALAEYEAERDPADLSLGPAEEFTGALIRLA